MSDRVITIAVALLLASAILPGAVDNFVAVDTSSWPTMLQSGWTLIPALGIFGIGLYFWQRKRGRG